MSLDNLLGGGAVGRRPKAQVLRRANKTLGWNEAIEKVLRSANEPLHYTEIAERIVADDMVRSYGATPAANVAVYLSNSLKERNSPYARLGRGLYTLKAAVGTGGQAGADSGTIADQQAEIGGIGALGMFWKRSDVFWFGTPTLLGVWSRAQGAGATNVNFAGQVGIYLLHDGVRVIYVGRTIDTLFARLRSHTMGRLSGRWDRFSWFGLRSVDEGGTLSDPVNQWIQDKVIATMEAVLIESLEPPQNRRSGDNLSAVEYHQVPDRRIENTGKKAPFD